MRRKDYDSSSSSSKDDDDDEMMMMMIEVTEKAINFTFSVKDMVLVIYQ